MNLFRKSSHKKKSYVVKTGLVDQIFSTPHPPNMDEPLDTITAEEVITKLDRGETVVRKRIIGDLILGQNDLQNIFEFDDGGGKKVIIDGLPSPPSFVCRLIEKEIKIEGCIVMGHLNLAGLWLKKKLIIKGTRFCSTVDLQHSIFDKGVFFGGNYLEKKSNFNDTTHLEDSVFFRTTFKGPAEFYNTEFLEGLTLTRIIFDDVCNFSHSNFHSTNIIIPCLGFEDVLCKDVAYFVSSKFEGIADFSNSQFLRNAEFTDATFRFVKFIHTKIDYLGLKWEQIENHKILFGEILFSKVSSLDPVITTKTLNKYFLSRDDATLPEKHRQYDILKAIFIKQGDHVSADGCFYEWKQVERKQSPLNLNPESWIVKLFHYLNWLSCGYGVKPLRTLLFSAIIIFIFAAIYTFLDPTVNLSFGLHRFLFFGWHSLIAQFVHYLEFSFTTFMNIGSEITFSNRAGHSLFLIERLLGWFTLLLFVTTYTRIMLR